MTTGHFVQASCSEVSFQFEILRSFDLALYSSNSNVITCAKPRLISMTLLADRLSVGSLKLTSFKWRGLLTVKSLNVCLHMNLILSVRMPMQPVWAIILQAEQLSLGPRFCTYSFFSNISIDFCCD